MILKNYKNKSLNELNPDQIAKDTAEYGLVIIENSDCSPKQFADWSLQYGYHLSPRIWCTDTEHSELFWRVTNKVIDNENQGLFADYELNWHTNITPVPDAEECVGLYGKEITYTTQTWFCNSIEWFDKQTKDFKEYLESLTVVLDPKRELGLIKSIWQPNFKNIYGDKVFDDIKKNRRTRNICLAANLETENVDAFQNSRGIINECRLVPKHPLGVKGIFFTPYEIHGFKQDGKYIKDSKKLWDLLYTDLVNNEKNIYKHTWKVGDIVLMDQLLTIHKRPDIKKNQTRELLRIASWYKKHLRIHNNYTL